MQRAFVTICCFAMIFQMGSSGDSSLGLTSYFSSTTNFEELLSSNATFDPVPNFGLDPTPNPIIIRGNCSKAFTNFTNAIVDFTNCSINHARPIQLCMECGLRYNVTVKAYESLQRQESDCLEYFFRSDQLAIIDIFYNGASSLWEKSYCPDCYKYYEDSVAFFNASLELTSCLEIFNESSPFSENNTCKRCADIYTTVTNDYNKFVKHTEEFDKGICMDIVDSMNITRRLWKEYNCVVEFDTSIGSSNVITALVFGVTPLLFYLLARNVSRIEEVIIVRPKRKFTSSVVIDDSIPTIPEE